MEWDQSQNQKHVLKRRRKENHLMVMGGFIVSGVEISHCELLSSRCSIGEVMDNSAFMHISGSRTDNTWSNSYWKSWIHLDAFLYCTLRLILHVLCFALSPLIFKAAAVRGFCTTSGTKWNRKTRTVSKQVSQTLPQLPVVAKKKQKRGRRKPLFNFHDFPREEKYIEINYTGQKRESCQIYGHYLSNCIRKPIATLLVFVV